MHATLDPIYSASAPPELFHYTTHAGLIGIATSKHLWATHLRFMNDNREVDDGISLFERAIDSAWKAGKLGPRTEPFDSWRTESGVLFAASVGMYAFCPSELGDDLSQWRAYCASGGYSLGCDGPALSRRLERNRLADLCKVVYEPRAKEAIAESVVQTAGKLWMELRPLPVATRAPRLRALGQAIQDVVLTCISVFKDRAFSNEVEWRMVASGDLSDPGAVRYRAGRSSVVPYVEIPLFRRGDRLLRKAIVGPNPVPELAHAGMGDCLNDAGFIGVDESVSKVPYRSW
jgi:hypothetical protein